MMMGKPTQAQPADQTVQQCIDKMREFEIFAKKNTPKEIQPHQKPDWDEHLKSTLEGTKFVCARNDMEGSIRLLYQKVCPRLAGCDKLKVVMDRGLTAQDKKCLAELVDGIIEDPQLRFGYRSFGLPPEVVVVVVGVLGNKCISN
jgi:hypothetical protein